MFARIMASCIYAVRILERELFPSTRSEILHAQRTTVFGSSRTVTFKGYEKKMHLETQLKAV